MYAAMLRDGPAKYIQMLKDEVPMFEKFAASNEYDNAYLKQLHDTALKAKELKSLKVLYEQQVSILLDDVEVDSRCKSRARLAPERLWIPRSSK